ncbi:hypothetical protein [Actinomadura hibisca]|uniref:hypothetical protein n=1 Tax=Actinomadura hibisca TaxID=68565 RepID=UPI0008350103|nr:hypothetical protein [Actinomadura hibisca]
MSNNTAHEMSPGQGRVTGRYAHPGDPVGMTHPLSGMPQGAVMANKELDPAVAGLVAWLPPSGGTLSRAAIDRWTDAARTVLTLAHARDEEERQPAE